MANLPSLADITAGIAINFCFHPNQNLIRQLWPIVFAHRTDSRAPFLKLVTNFLNGILLALRLPYRLQTRR
jgi:hypothetical protein